MSEQQNKNTEHGFDIRKKLFRWLFFVPYGKNLLADKAFYSLAAMWMISVAIAGLEGFAWYGVVAHRSDLGIWAAWAAAIGVGGLFWFADAAFITYCPSQLISSSDSTRQVMPVQQTRWIWSLSPLFKGAVARGFVVLFSLGITMSLLGKAFQHNEVMKAIESHNQVQIAHLKQSEQERIQTKYQTPIEAAREEKSLLEQNYTLESGGIRHRDGSNIQAGSGLRGIGPVALSIKERIEAKKAEIAKLDSDRDAELAATLKLIGDNEATPEGREKLKFSFPASDTFRLFGSTPAEMERARALYLTEGGAKMMGLPEHQVIAGGILLSLFLLMASLKFLEPEGIKTYFNESLQQNYRDYLHGAFDHLLEPSRKSTSLSPLGVDTFPKWFYGVYEQIKLSKEQEKELTGLRKLRAKTTKELEEYRGQLTDLHDTIDQATVKRDRLTNKQEELIAQHEAEQKKQDAERELAQQAVREKQQSMKHRLQKLKQREEELRAEIRSREEDVKNYLARLSATAHGTEPVPGEDSKFDNLKDALSDSRFELKSTRNKVFDQEAALNGFEIKHTDSALPHAEPVSSRAVQLSESERDELTLTQKRLTRLNMECETLQGQVDGLQGAVKQIDERIAMIELGQVSAPSIAHEKPVVTEPSAELTNGKLTSPLVNA